MDILLLGVGIGLLTLIPPGPVSLALVQVGARLGHRSAMHGAAGVASGDVVLGIAAVLIVGMGASLPASAFAAGQIVAALLLTIIGIGLIARPDAAAASVERIQRPGRALFLLTSLTPTALGAWIALLAAMPFAADPTSITVFAVGVIIASMVWHPLLGSLASQLGSRLSERGQSRLSRTGGVCMALLGTVLVTGQLL